MSAIVTRSIRQPSSRVRVQSLLLTVVVGIGGVVFLIPFVWLIVAATHDTGTILGSPGDFIPGDQLVKNVTGLFASSSFGSALLNSLFVTAIYTAGGLAVCTLAGYAFAKFRFRGQNILFGAVLVTLALPSQVTLVPLFQIMVQLGWLNSYQALILPNLALPFGIFLMRQNLQALPDELLQAARVDGAGEFRTFFQIALPTVRPALAALAIFLFLAQWNDFVYPLIVLRTENAYTLPVALASLQGIGSTDYGQLLTGTLISVVPVLAMFLFFQRYFVSGLLSGAVKQ